MLILIYPYIRRYLKAHLNNGLVSRVFTNDQGRVKPMTQKMVLDAA